MRLPGRAYLCFAVFGLGFALATPPISLSQVFSVPSGHTGDDIVDLTGSGVRVHVADSGLSPGCFPDITAENVCAECNSTHAENNWEAWTMLLNDDPTSLVCPDEARQKDIVHSIEELCADELANPWSGNTANANAALPSAYNWTSTWTCSETCQEFTVHGTDLISELLNCKDKLDDYYKYFRLGRDCRLSIHDDHCTSSQLPRPASRVPRPPSPTYPPTNTLKPARPTPVHLSPKP